MMYAYDDIPAVSMLLFLPVAEWPSMSPLARMLHLSARYREQALCWGDDIADRSAEHWQNAQRRYASQLIGRGL